MKFLTNRDPVFLVAAIQSVLSLLLSFGVLDFVGLTTQDDLMLLIGVLNGLGALYLAFVTSETLLAPLIEVVKAGLAFGAIYGLSISIEQTGLLIGAITALFAAYQRTQTTPLPVPTFAVISPTDTETPYADDDSDYIDGLLYATGDEDAPYFDGPDNSPLTDEDYGFAAHGQPVDDPEQTVVSRNPVAFPEYNEVQPEPAVEPEDPFAGQRGSEHS